VSSSRDFYTGVRNSKNQDIVFRFTNQDLHDKFERSIAILTEREQRALAEMVDTQAKQGIFKTNLEDRTVEVYVRGLKDTEPSRRTITIESFVIAAKRAPAGNPKLIDLLREMAGGTQTPGLIAKLRPLAHPLTWPKDDRVKTLLGVAPRDLPAFSIDPKYFDEALAFLAAVEGQDISIDTPQRLTLSDGTQVSIATNRGNWAVNETKIDSRLVHLYKILDTLECSGSLEGLKAVSAGGDVKRFTGGELEARLGSYDRIIYTKGKGKSIEIKDVWGHT
jgi:hypothetical protein